MEPFFVDYLDILQTLSRDFVATFEDLPADALDWIPGAEMNSFGILVVHTTASARFWIGDAALGESSNRNRDDEFRAHGLNGADLKARFDALESYAQGAAERLSVADLSAIRSISNREGKVRQVTVGWALLHALEHTGLHLGHAQITRQLWQRR
ncbi:MAG: DinB family protein [Chloroflexota bacterium]